MLAFTATGQIVSLGKVEEYTKDLFINRSNWNRFLVSHLDKYKEIKE